MRSNYTGARDFTKSADMALLTRQTLQDSGSEVALVGRVGQDLSKYGMRYSHIGFVLRDSPQGPWSVVHLLNNCGKPTSELFDEGLGNFFLDDVFKFEVLILIPPADLRPRLASILNSHVPVSLHQPDYSMLASPYSTKYQNSNQWVLEILMAAMQPSDDPIARSQEQRQLKTSGYRPARVSVSPMERLGASLFRANVQFDDHSAEERSSGRYEMVSVDSIADFLTRPGSGWTRQVIALP